MATSSPASGISGTRAFIPFADTTDTAPAGTGVQTLSTAPDRTSSALQQALPAGNAGQQNPLPIAGQPTVSSRPYTSTPAFFKADQVRRDNHIPDSHAGQWYASVGILLQARDMPAEALEYLLHALSIEEERLGIDHPDVSSLYKTVGSLLRDQGKHAQAVEYFLKALPIDEKRLGTDHPNVSSLYKTIGSLLRDQDKHAQAVEYFFKALSIDEKRPDTDYRHFGVLHYDIGLLLCKQNKREQGMSFLLKALAIQENGRVTDNANTTSYQNIKL